MKLLGGEMIDYSFAGNLGTALSFLEFTGGSISNPGAEYAVSAFRYILKSGEETIPHFLPEKVVAEKNKASITFPLIFPYNFVEIFPRRLMTSNSLKDWIK